MSIHNIPLQVWEDQQEFPWHHTLEIPNLRTEASISSASPGHIYIKTYSFANTLISYAELSDLKETVRFSRQVEGESIEMIFILKGKSQLLTGHHVHHRFEDGEHNLYYGSAYADDFLIDTQDGQLQFLVVHLAGREYIQFFKESSYVEKLLHKKSYQGLVGSHNMLLTPAMKWIIHDIKSCTRQGAHKQLFLQAKVLELLSLQCEQIIRADHQEEDIATSSDSDVEQLREAKAILEANITSPPTIHQLSKMIGLNDFYLKKRFKDMFGTTIFGYVNQIKMEKARYLLSQEDKSVSETAFAIGYKNPQHFTAAFKRYFGMLPSTLRQKG